MHGSRERKLIEAADHLTKPYDEMWGIPKDNSFARLFGVAPNPMKSHKFQLIEEVAPHGSEMEFCKRGVTEVPGSK